MLADQALVSMAECDEELTFPDEFSNEFAVPHIKENIPDVLLEDDEPEALVHSIFVCERV